MTQVTVTGHRLSTQLNNFTLTNRILYFYKEQLTKISPCGNRNKGIDTDIDTDDTDTDTGIDKGIDTDTDTVTLISTLTYKQQTKY